MTVHTQKDALLVLTLDSVDYACQVISGEFAYPTKGEATLIPVACGDSVSETGDPVNGSITGEVLKDTSATGITRALITALEADAELDYSWVENGDSADLGMTVTGKCRVAGHVQTFTPDQNGRHSLDLTVTTAATTWGANPATP